MGDRVEKEIVEKFEELVVEKSKEVDEDLEKFTVVERELADWEGVVGPGGGKYCTVDELFKIIEGKYPCLFSSSSSLREFLAARPHLFRITMMDTVAVRIEEDRRKLIEIVRFIHSSPPPVTIAAVLERFWKEEAKRAKEKQAKMDEEGNGNEMEWWEVPGGGWIMSPVWKTIRKGEGVFILEEDTISLSEAALTNDSFFNDVYLNYSDEIVRRIDEEIKLAEENDLDPSTVRKQRQTHSSQVSLLAVAREVKSKYMKALVLAPAKYASETVYILPNQIGIALETKKTKYYAGQMMQIRAHDVIGDESLKNRFRADEINEFPLRAMREFMPKGATLAPGKRDQSLNLCKPLFHPKSLFDRVACDKRESREAEYEHLMEEAHGTRFVAQTGLSDIILPTKALQAEFDEVCAFEEYFVKEMDNLITCGIKKMREHGGEKGAARYPLAELLEDLRSRSITAPDEPELIDHLTVYELEKDLAARPHLYSLSGDAVCFCNREAVDRLLMLLDTDRIWDVDALTEALGQGRAGEEWKDESIAELARGLYPLLRKEDQFLSLGARRRSDGLWVRDSIASQRATMLERHTVRPEEKIEYKEEVYYEEKAEEEDKENSGQENGIITRGRGRGRPFQSVVLDHDRVPEFENR